MTSTPGFQAGPPRHSLQASFVLPVCGDLGFMEWEVQSSGTGCGVTAGSHSPPILDRAGVRLHEHLVSGEDTL